MIDLAKEDPIHVNEVCKLFGVHRCTVEGWFDRGLEKAKVGGLVYTTREALQRFASGDVTEADPHSNPEESNQDEGYQEARRGLREAFGI